MRVFTAIEIPKSIRDEIAKVSREFDEKGIVLVDKEAIHITLQFIGEINEVELSKIIQSLESIKSYAKSFEINLKGIATFDPGSIRVVFAQVAAGYENCIGIYNLLSDAFVRSKVKFKKGNYTPHATIARIKEFADRGRILRVISKYQEDEFGNFVVRNIKLKQSFLSSNGPTYKDLYELKF